MVYTVLGGDRIDFKGYQIQSSIHSNVYVSTIVKTDDFMHTYTYNRGHGTKAV